MMKKSMLRLGSRLECKNHTPYLWPKWLKNHTLWCCTHLYSPYKGVTPPPTPSTGSRLTKWPLKNKRLHSSEFWWPSTNQKFWFWERKAWYWPCGYVHMFRLALSNHFNFFAFWDTYTGTYTIVTLWSSLHPETSDVGSFCNLCELALWFALQTVLTSSKKGETAVHFCDPALSVLVMLVSPNIFHVLAAYRPKFYPARNLGSIGRSEIHQGTGAS